MSAVAVRTNSTVKQEHAIQGLPYCIIHGK